MINKAAIDYARENNHQEIVNILSKGKIDKSKIKKAIDIDKKDLSKTVDIQTLRINILENDNRERIEEIISMKKELKSLQSKVSQLESINIKLVKENKEKTNEINKLKKKLESFQKKASQLESINIKIVKENKEKTNEINKLKKEFESFHDIESNTINPEKENEKINELKNFLFALKDKLRTIDFIDINNYEEESIIGEGSTSKVKIVVKKEKYAMKELTEFTHETLKRFINEGEILFQLRHPCIIRIHGFFLGNEDHAPSMILSLEPKTLETSINNHELDNEKKNQICVEIVLGMRYIHFHNFMHRDLKPSNILLSKNYHVRISDFGLAKEENIEISQSKGVGNLLFMAPELFEENEDDVEENIRYTNKVDIYSFGILLICIITETYPKFRLKRVKSGSIPPLPETISKWVEKLITKCLSLSPDERPSFSEIFDIMKSNNYDLFSDSKNKKLTKKQKQMKENIESRILKIKAFEFQHQNK